ncbi:hypothetical protein ABT224_19825 [Streptomyces sp. NPDC001584]|uniref:hypothetical protein n=1 Tax=Streptomyces sp. NPDC001584 TaxID=3154521 RepID=UPI00331E4495
MSNQADDNDLDVLIHRRALSTTVVAESRSGASESLLATLDGLGFQRQGQAIYVWHELPDDMDPAEVSRTCRRAASTLLAAGYTAEMDERLIQQPQ